MEAKNKQKIFYGWWVVVASSIIIFLGTGIIFYSFGVFLKPLEAEFGWSRTMINLSVAVWALLFGFSGPVVGALISKYGARAVILGSALITGSCYFLLYHMQNLSTLFIIMFVMGVGSVGITLIPNQTLVSNWFEKYRGRAMGIMMAGIGFGGLIMPPFANFMIERYNWRTSFLVLGLLIITIAMPVALLLVRNRPSDMGLNPDGIASEADELANARGGGSSGAAGLTLKRAVRTPSFWLLFFAFMLLVFGESGLTVNFVAFVDDAGIPSQRAAVFWGVAAGISSIGRLGFGFLADRWNPRTLIALTHGFHAIAVGILLVFFLGMGIHSAATLFPFSLVYGLSLGGSAVLLPVLVGRCFGLPSFSKILGLLMSGFALGVVGGPLLAGHIFDTTGSYRLALIIYTIAFAVAALAVALIQPDRYRNEFVVAQEAGGADG